MRRLQLVYAPPSSAGVYRFVVVIVNLDFVQKPVALLTPKNYNIRLPARFIAEINPNGLHQPIEGDKDS